MHEIGYLIGKYWKKVSIAYVFILALISIFLYSISEWSKTTKIPPANQIQTQQKMHVCLKDEKMLAQYQQHMDKKEFFSASRSIAYCVVESKDPALTEKQKIAETLSYEQDAHNTKISPQSRMAGIEKLLAMHPSRADEFSALIPKLRLEIKKANEEAKRRELAILKSQGVQLGMTQEQVLLSSWGRPERVNRTTNAYGVREQWVYGNRNYLYFKNGILESIQN